jgi:hypothetical protein
MDICGYAAVILDAVLVLVEHDDAGCKPQEAAEEQQCQFHCPWKSVFHVGTHSFVVARVGKAIMVLWCT